MLSHSPGICHESFAGDGCKAFGVIMLEIEGDGFQNEDTSRIRRPDGSVG